MEKLETWKYEPLPARCVKLPSPRVARTKDFSIDAMDTSQLTPGGSIRASTVASLQTEHRTQVSHRLDAPYCWSSVSSSSSCHEAHAWVNVVVLLLARFHGNPIPSNLRAVDASYWLRGTISWGQKLPVRRAAGAWRALPHLSLCPLSFSLSGSRSAGAYRVLFADSHTRTSGDKQPYKAPLLEVM